ncbi:MOSC domain-containing protein [Ascidiaceihabitans sp.]|nr:MOSC domain-containing protein [Ascidiaceihabitans sp.]|tara:strand:- start:88 stop:669 length:582 start_codon:yes stop_codon:yes gene_type:complete
MPALMPTEYTARITWLGRVVADGDTMRSEPLNEVMAVFGGFAGEAHFGVTRPSCVRVRSQHKQGTTIKNVRQLSVMSAEEIAHIAKKMGLEDIDPTLLGASLILEGIADFTHLPPSSRLQSDTTGATLIVDMVNRPCVLPGREIEMEHEGFGAKFKPAAVGKRGVTASVEREGLLEIGDVMRLHIPDQRSWSP